MSIFLSLFILTSMCVDNHNSKHHIPPRCSGFCSVTPPPSPWDKVLVNTNNYIKINKPYRTINSLFAQNLPKIVLSKNDIRFSFTKTSQRGPNFFVAASGNDFAKGKLLIYRPNDTLFSEKNNKPMYDSSKWGGVGIFPTTTPELLTSSLDLVRRKAFSKYVHRMTFNLRFKWLNKATTPE